MNKTLLNTGADLLLDPEKFDAMVQNLINGVMQAVVVSALVSIVMVVGFQSYVTRSKRKK